MKFNLKKIIVVENDHNFFWKNMKNNFDDFILQTNNLIILKMKKIIAKNNQKKSYQKNEINDFEKTTKNVENKVSCNSKIMIIDIQILNMKKQIDKFV